MTSEHIPNIDDKPRRRPASASSGTAPCDAGRDCRQANDEQFYSVSGGSGSVGVGGTAGHSAGGDRVSFCTEAVATEPPLCQFGPGGDYVRPWPPATVNAATFPEEMSSRPVLLALSYLACSLAFAATAG